MSPEPEDEPSTSSRAQRRCAVTRQWLEEHQLHGRVALVSDERMLQHCGKKNHPERPARLAEILRQLELSGLRGACDAVASREATALELRRVHSEQHVEAVAKSGELKKPGKTWGMLGPDNYCNESTPLCSSLSAGCLLALVDHCCSSSSSSSNGTRCGFAAVRPPGHHASEDKASGFCMFNNVALAARHAQQVHGLEKICIVDWDVHHGNGTNDIFAEDASVLFFSFHRGTDFYPGTGFVEDVGKASARGYNVNVPLGKGFGDHDVVHVIRYLLCPLMDKFQPDAILVSAGFDAVRDDPLGECHVSPEGFGWMTRSLYRLAKHYCEGRLWLALEGGYHPDRIAQCTVECVRTLLAEAHGIGGPELEDLVPPTPMSSLPGTPKTGPSCPTSPSLSLKSGEAASRGSTPSLRPEGSPPASPALSASGKKSKGPASKTVHAVRKATEVLRVLPPMDVELAPLGEGASKNSKKNERRRQRKHSEDSSDSSWAIACGGDPDFPSPASPMRMVMRQLSGSSNAPELELLELPPPLEEPKDAKDAKEVKAQEEAKEAEKEKDPQGKSKSKRKGKKK